MALRIGQVLRGVKGSYELLHPLKDSKVFKAKILANSTTRAQWAMIKTATTDYERMCLNWEYHTHNDKAIATDPNIRAMQDTIHLGDSQGKPSCLVFEWMDHDLASISTRQFRSNPKLPKIVSKAVLSGLQTLKSLNAVHADVSINNVFLSDIYGDTPVAKLGDLGNAIKDGSATQRSQCFSCRAPEVWQGWPCRHVSDVWSLGVTLTTMLSPQILFGPRDFTITGGHEPLYIANIIRRLGPLAEPVDPNLAWEFELANILSASTHQDDTTKKLMTVGHWRKEMEEITDPPVSPDILDFIESLLIIDPAKRPTAAEALLHPYLWDLERNKEQIGPVIRDTWWDKQGSFRLEPLLNFVKGYLV